MSTVELKKPSLQRHAETFAILHEHDAEAERFGTSHSR